MIMDTLAGIAFAYEPPLIEYMKEKPKKKSENILNRYMLDEIFITGTYSSLLCIMFLKSDLIHSLFRSDLTNKYIMTAFFGLFIFIGIFNCFNARTNRINLLANLWKNKAFIIIISMVVIIQLFLIYFGGDAFRTYGLTIFELATICLLSFTVIPVDWLRKLYLRKRKHIQGV